MTKAKRGFARLSKEALHRISVLGGKSMPAEKRSFSQDRKLAAEAGRKGGKALEASKRTFFTRPELARSAGAKSHTNRKP